MKYPSYLEAYIHSISPEQKRGKLGYWIKHITGAVVIWAAAILVVVVPYVLRP